jgi:succinyl-CoA synthetase alpha subunit
MAIFLDENSKIIVQGMTGSEGMKHTARMLKGGLKHRWWREPAQGWRNR